jgi:5-hydroxyisourate hydrolase-like protein (transthyretin family)
VTAGATTTGIDFALGPGGRITGTVTDEATGLPLASVRVSIYDGDGRGVASGRTDSSGAYASEGGLSSGTYYARTENSLGYLDELYHDVPWPGWPVGSGTPILVTAGATTSGIDFSLRSMGRISGTVRDAATGLPLAGVRVSVQGSTNPTVTSALTDGNGAWATGVSLSPGTYYARTWSSAGYVDEVYDDIACPYPTCPVATGRPITVTAGATTTGIDFGLVRGGRIGGTVRDAATGLPLAYVDVRIYTATGGQITTTLTNALGVYATHGGSGMASGTYYALTSNSLGYVDELYGDIPCPGGGCPVTAGTPISVAAGATTGGIDFGLVRGGRLAGIVTDAATGLPLKGVEVSIHDSGGTRVTGRTTDLWGGFTSVDALAPGTYYARTSNDLGYSDELYNEAPCPGGVCSVTAGTPIAVAAGVPAARIGFSLSAGGRISGAVTDAGTGLPLAEVRVRIHDAIGRPVTSGTTDASGAWAISTGLPAGTYYARTEGAPGHVDELWDGNPCPLGVCTVTSGTPIHVTAGATTAGVDFGLDPSPALSFYTLVPCRVIDTRNPDGPLGGPSLAAGVERTFSLAGACGIPMTAKAVSVNVTVTEPTQLGNVRLYPAGAPTPQTSTVNYPPGVTRAGNATVSLDAAGRLAVLASPSGAVHIVVDVNGYYE